MALLAASCFIVISLAENIQLVLLGVIFASMSSGFGEVTFLSFTTHYHKSTVGGWSSGTGNTAMGVVIMGVIIENDHWGVSGRGTGDHVRQRQTVT